MTDYETSPIADLIQGQLGHLIEDWTHAVRDDPRIQSDEKLSKPELIDHVPAVIKEICELIRKSETPGVRNSLEARANVYTRLYQGYTGRDLVRELSLLRITLLDYLMEISSSGQLHLSSKERHDVATIINLYLDEEMRYAISIFCNRSIDSQQEPLPG
jgi:hypothetical protein